MADQQLTTGEELADAWDTETPASRREHFEEGLMTGPEPVPYDPGLNDYRPPHVTKIKPTPPVIVPDADNSGNWLANAWDAAEEDTWEFYEYTKANSAMQSVQHILRELFHEPLDNFGRGFIRGGAELSAGTLLLARDIAGMSPDMPGENVPDFIQAMLNVAKSMDAYDGNDREAQFFDRMWYHLGHAAPGMIAALGVTAGTAAAMPVIAPYVGLSALVKYGNSFGRAADILLRTGTIFTVGSEVSVANEYANATMEKREPQGWEVFKLDMGFNAAGALTFGALNALPVHPFWKISTAGAIGTGVTAAMGGDEAEQAAMGIMFALMSGGMIKMTKDNPNPSSVRMAYKQIKNWIAARKEANKKYDIESYYKEHKPITHFQAWQHDTPYNQAKIDFSPQRNYDTSPWDLFIRSIEKQYGLDKMEGAEPHQLAEQMFQSHLAAKSLTQQDRQWYIPMSHGDIQARLRINEQWLQDYRKRHGFDYDPAASIQGSKYLEGVQEPVRQLKPKEIIDINDKRMLRQKVAVETYTKKKKDSKKGETETKTRDLPLWKLSQEEAVRLFSKEADPAVAELTGEAMIIREVHKEAVEAKLKRGQRVPVHALYAYKDTLGTKYAELYAKRKPIEEVHRKETGWGKLMREHLTEEEIENYSYRKLTDWHDETMRKGRLKMLEEQRGFIKQLAYEAGKGWDYLYEGLVDAGGNIAYKWRKKGWNTLADAYHNHYGASSKTAYDWLKLDQETKISEWSPDFLAEVNKYVRSVTMRAHTIRMAGQRGRKVDTPMSNAEVEAAGRAIVRKASSPDSKWTPKDLTDASDAIYHVFNRSLQYAYNNDLITPKVYGEIKDFPYSPTYTTRRTMEAISKLGSDSNRISVKGVLDYLAKDVGDDVEFDIRRLLHSHLAKTNAAVAKNRILVEAARVAWKNPEQRVFVGDWDPVPGHIETHVKYQYLQDGKPRGLWIDKETSRLVESGLLTNLADTGKRPLTNAVLQALSGAAVKRALISSDPTWAVSMIIPDAMHIAMAHPEFHSKGMKIGTWFDLYKRGIEYAKGDKKAGVDPFHKNVVDAYRKIPGGVFDEAVQSGLAVITLATESIDDALVNQIVKQGLKSSGRKNYQPLKEVKQAFHQYQRLSSSLEMGARLTEYQMLKATGMSPEAAAAAVNERLNYGRTGKWMQGPRKYMAFLNAGVQATDSIAKMAIDNPKMVIKMIPQLMLWSAAVRGWNEFAAPGADMDRTMEDRIYKSMIFVPGLSKKERHGNDFHTIHYGFPIKDGMNPIASAAKLLTIGIGDYWYSLANPDKFPDGPVLWDNDRIHALYSGIVASTPAELQGYMPAAVDIISIYAQNTKLLGRSEIWKGQETYPGGEIVEPYSTQPGEPTSPLAQHITSVVPGDSILGSPERGEAAFDTYLPRSTMKDTMTGLLKLMGNRAKPEWDVIGVISEDIPIFNRYMEGTTPYLAEYHRGRRQRDVKWENYDKHVMTKVRPLFREMYGKFSAASKRGGKYAPSVLLNNEEQFNKWAKEKLHDGMWPTPHGTSYAKSALNEVKRFRETILEWVKFDELMGTKGPEGPYPDAHVAIGPLSAWMKATRGEGITPADKAQYIYYKWRELYNVHVETPGGIPNIMNTFSKFIRTHVVTDKNVGDQTLAIFDELRRNYRKQKGD